MLVEQCDKPRFWAASDFYNQPTPAKQSVKCVCMCVCVRLVGKCTVPMSNLLRSAGAKIDVSLTDANQRPLGASSTVVLREILTNKPDIAVVKYVCGDQQNLTFTYVFCYHAVLPIKGRNSDCIRHSSIHP